MRKSVELEYGIRHRNFVNNVRFNDSIGVFSTDGELQAVITCDPDGVYHWGEIDYGYNYLGGGKYQVLFYDSNIILKPVLYAYGTKHGLKFVVEVGKDDDITKLVSLKVGENIADKILQMPVKMGIASLDGYVRYDDIDIYIGVEVYDNPRYVRVADVYGVRNKEVVEKIYRFIAKHYGKPYNVFHRNTPKTEESIITKYPYELIYGQDRQGFNGYHIVYRPNDLPPVIVWTGYDIQEAFDTFKGIVALKEGVVVEEKLWLPPEDKAKQYRKLFAIEDDYKFTIFYEDDDYRLRGITISKDRDLRLFNSYRWNDRDKEVIADVLGGEFVKV